MRIECYLKEFLFKLTLHFVTLSSIVKVHEMVKEWIKPDINSLKKKKLATSFHN